ncbi:MAG: hypothetical protein DRJ09_08365 [Bacteroidetes bacterium]|nr:MAG: hypothetical protein DRJ09_08365 [Bacteroidota bacterium]
MWVFCKTDNMKIRLFFLLLLTSFSWVAISQTSGCTDPQANNFNPDATLNDGSCSYNITLFTPKLKYVLPDEIDETSGLAFFNGGLWTLNDSGGEPVIYKLDTATGHIVQRIRIGNATNVDWEDMTDDSLFVYVGDFGNNSGNRKDLKIYKIKKSDIPASGDVTVEAEIINFYYPDQPDKKIKKRRYNNFDCEAVLAMDDSLFLFSKDWQDQRTRVYALPKVPGDYAATLVDSFNVSGLVTAADYNAKSNEVVLLGYTNQSWIPFTWLLFDFNGHHFFSGNKRRVDMPNIMTTQTEGFAYVEGKEAILSSEKTSLGAQSAYRFNTGKWTGSQPSFVIENGGNQFDFVISPNPVQGSKIAINITNIPDGEYKLLLYDSLGRLLQYKKIALKRKKEKLTLSLKTYKLSPGSYTLKLINGEKALSKTFIKK